jgi:hypothetical protein
VAQESPVTPKVRQGMGFHLFMCVMPLPENGVIGNDGIELAEKRTFQELRHFLISRTVQMSANAVRINPLA